MFYCYCSIAVMKPHSQGSLYMKPFYWGLWLQRVRVCECGTKAWRLEQLGAHILICQEEVERTKWDRSESFDPQRSHLRGTSLNTTPSNPSQAVSPTGDQVFVLIQTTTGLITRKGGRRQKRKNGSHIRLRNFIKAVMFIPCPQFSDYNCHC